MYFPWCRKSGGIPTRFNIAVMIFLACVISYMMRVNLSINIIAMVQYKGNGTNSTAILPDYGPRYSWTNKEQSLLLGSFFWGYLLSSLPGGLLAEQFGATNVVGYSLLFSSILTALTPLVASLHYWCLLSLRFLTGLLAGVVFPSNHCLIAKWSPENEKGKFISTLMGGTFGTMITWPLCGLVVESIGWVWAFYVTAGISLFIVVLWFLCVADSPMEHKRIAQKEVNYIEESIGPAKPNQKKLPPFLKVLKSLPFWALLILHYGNTWGLHFSMTVTPKFLSEVLEFNLTKAGFLSSLPYVARISFGFIFGTIGDIVRQRKILSVTNIRKTFCIFSHIIPGICLICLALFARNPYVCVAFMTLSLGFNGASTITNLQNAQDLAPNYAGTIYGAINLIGVTPGFFAPLLVAYFTEEQNTLDEWVKIFIIGAVIYIVPAFVFAIFGSGEVQPWNENNSEIRSALSNSTKTEKEKELNTKL